MQAYLKSPLDLFVGHPGHVAALLEELADVVADGVAALLALATLGLPSDPAPELVELKTINNR